MKHVGLIVVSVVGLMMASASFAGSSLRFYGTGSGDIDRVKVRIDAPQVPADIGATDFTIEFWMKANAADNGSRACSTADAEQWIYGNIMIDRDVFYSPDYGKFGIALFSGGLGYGVNNRLGRGAMICGTTPVADGAWHHVAATYQYSDGRIQLFVDGRLEGSAGWSGGDVSYRNGRATSYPNSDPYLVFGAEKHDAGRNYPSFSGWLDEVRLSNVRRYTAAFTAPTQAFMTDANTVALYHFDEAAGGNGTVIQDSSGAAGGPSNGILKVGGPHDAPKWSTDTPFEGGGVTPPPVGVLQFKQAAYSAVESVGQLSLEVQRINGSAGAVSVQFATQPGSAQAGSDYQHVHGTLSWNDGDAGSRWITLPVLNDALFEPDPETLTVKLSMPMGGAKLGPNGTATITISDDELPPPPDPEEVTDTDGDGFSIPEDCDETDPAIHPAALDIPGDGIDQNCDGADAVAPPPTELGVSEAGYRESIDHLLVRAVSGFAASANLRVRVRMDNGQAIETAMSWNASGGYWEKDFSAFLRTYASYPFSVTVLGPEGSATAAIAYSW